MRTQVLKFMHVVCDLRVKMISVEVTAGKCLDFTRGVYGPIGGVLTILAAVGTAVGSEAPQGVQGGAPGWRAAGDWSQQATSWLWPWASSFNSQSLSFLNCEMGSTAAYTTGHRRRLNNGSDSTWHGGWHLINGHLLLLPLQYMYTQCDSPKALKYLVFVFLLSLKIPLKDPMKSRKSMTLRKTAAILREKK